MSVSFKWTSTIIVWFSIIDLRYSAFIKKEITCYVCAPAFISDNTEASEILITFSNYNIEHLPTCGSEAAINFTLKCPEGYEGCLTKIYGNNILKSCNEYRITDCKIANNVKYCFCADNLCNYATVLTPIPLSTDDEDLDQSTEEGSGLFDDWTQLDKYKHTEKNISSTVILNNTPTKNNSFMYSSVAKLFYPKYINIVSLIPIIYNIM